ncbi:MAG TPA: hypothetical protein VEL05_03165, partial [Candidatus Acidoferrum sp.]|nr:hypothetical protein [Candidatus Acidoferrum sp.]
GHEGVSFAIIMVDSMTASIRRVLFATAGGALQLLLRVGRAGADHGAPLARESASPLVVAILAAVLVLTAGIAIVVIAMLLTKKTPRSE